MTIVQTMDREIKRCGVTKYIMSDLPGDIHGDILHIEILDWRHDTKMGDLMEKHLVNNVKTMLNEIKKANPAWKPKDIIVEIKSTEEEEKNGL